MDYNVINAGLSSAYIDTSYFEFTDSKSYPPYNILNVEIVTMEPGNLITLGLFTTGKETSLKQIFSRNLEYWHAAFPGRSPQDAHALSVYRKSLESIEGYSGKQLHILLLKYEGSKSARNPNALPLEQFCGTQFFGTLVVALSLTVSPYSLSSFKKSDMQILTNINKLRGNNKPAPMLTVSQPLTQSSPPLTQKSIKSNSASPIKSPKSAQLPVKSLEESFYEMPNDRFFMYRYKTVHCPNIGVKHDWNSCLYSHWIYDYRRPPDTCCYIAEMCPLVPPDRGGVCQDGDKCGYSHSPLEKLYHPSRYKVFPCESLRKNQPCPRKYACAFYHTTKEMRNPVTLKTQEPPQTFLSFAEPKMPCINIATNYFDILLSRKDNKPEAEFKWKRIEFNRQNIENMPSETKSMYEPKIKDFIEDGPNSVGALKDYFTLFSGNTDERQASTGVASMTSEAGKIFIGNQYIDNGEEQNEIFDESASDSKMTLICEDICSSDSARDPIKNH